MGRLLIALSLPAEHERIVGTHQSTGRPVRECERSILGFAHSELSAEALAFWNLPDPIQTAVLYHHDPGADETDCGPKAIRLSRVVSVANDYVNSLGISVLLNDPTKEKPGLDGIEALGLDEVRTLKLLAEFDTERDAMAQFFR